MQSGELPGATFSHNQTTSVQSTVDPESSTGALTSFLSAQRAAAQLFLCLCVLAYLRQ